jgi:hypothetical protein
MDGWTDGRGFVVLDGVARSILYDHAPSGRPLDVDSGCMNMSD